jgi:hypothetical protein
MTRGGEPCRAGVSRRCGCRGLSGPRWKFVGVRFMPQVGGVGWVASWAAIWSSSRSRSARVNRQSNGVAVASYTGLEGQDPFGEGVEVGQIVGAQDLALQDGVVDLDLVEPGRVYGQVHQLRGRPGLAHPVEGALSTVGGAVVHDPEHPLGAGVWLGGHGLGDQPAERLDPGRGLQPADHLGAVHVVSRDAHHPRLVDREAGMAAAAGLDGGLLIGAEDELVVTKRRAVTAPGVEVQRPSGFGSEVRIAWEDPGPMLPGLPARQRPASGARWTPRPPAQSSVSPPRRPAPERSTATTPPRTRRAAHTPTP